MDVLHPCRLAALLDIVHRADVPRAFTRLVPAVSHGVTGSFSFPVAFFGSAVGENHRVVLRVDHHERVVERFQDIVQEILARPDPVLCMFSLCDLALQLIPGVHEIFFDSADEDDEEQEQRSPHHEADGQEHGVHQVKGVKPIGGVPQNNDVADPAFSGIEERNVSTIIGSPIHLHPADRPLDDSHKLSQCRRIDS